MNEPTPQLVSPPLDRSAQRRAWLDWKRPLQIGVTVAVFAYLFASVDRRELARAFVRVDPRAWLLAALVSLLSLLCGLLRWRCLLRAFGAERRPPLQALADHYAAGYFYNTFLPGGITGDVIRSVATRQAFAAGSAGSFATVFMERALGLSALLALTALGTLAHPLPGLDRSWLPAAVGCSLAVVSVLLLFNARRLSARLPRALARLGQRLPHAHERPQLWAAGALSFATQAGAALCGHALMVQIDPSVRIADSLVIVPLAAAAAFVPISVSGAGVREGLFVFLYGLVGVPREAALAGSLALWCVQAAIAALGGLRMLALRRG